jgi:DHA1 family solute carrier family 18 vesicular amine transporter 1/2
MEKGRIARHKYTIEGGRPLLVLVSLLVFMDSVGYGLVVPVLPKYSQELGVSDFGIGFLFSVYAIAVLVGAIPLGWLADRLGRKPFILFGMFAMSGAFVFYALASSYWVLVIARALDGLTAAATWSAGLALLGDYYEDSVMGEKMGFAMGGAAIGGIAGPLIGGVMYDLAGYRSPFYLVAVLCAMIGVAAIFLREDRSHIQPGTGFVKMIKPMLRNRMLMLACLIALVTTIGFGMLEPTLPLHLEEKFSMSTSQIGMLFGVLTLFFALGSPLAGRLSDRAGRRLPILLGVAGTALLMPFLPLVSRAFLLYVIMAGLGLSIALFDTPSLPMITDSLTRKPGEGSNYGMAFGLLNIFWSMGYALGPLLGGAVFGAAGLINAYLVYSVLMVLLAVAVALNMRR